MSHDQPDIAAIRAALRDRVDRLTCLKPADRDSSLDKLQTSEVLGVVHGCLVGIDMILDRCKLPQEDRRDIAYFRVRASECLGEIRQRLEAAARQPADGAPVPARSAASPGRPLVQGRVKMAETIAAIERTMRGVGPMRSGDAIKAIGLPDKSIKYAVAFLVEQGRLRRRGWARGVTWELIR